MVCWHGASGDRCDTPEYAISRVDDCSQTHYSFWPNYGDKLLPERESFLPRFLMMDGFVIPHHGGRQASICSLKKISSVLICYVISES
jgi:hypothetical protein